MLGIPPVYINHLTSPWFALVVVLFIVGEVVVLVQGYSLQWQWMLIYFLTMCAISPVASSAFTFFKGGIRDNDTRRRSALLLGSSAFIAWVFAKSVYNSSVLGAEYGVMGGFAYACWYTAFASVSLTIYGLRQEGYRSLGEVINHKYGQGACLAFFLAVLFRLFQEIWSNSIVVAGFFGEHDSKAWWAAAILSAAIPLSYVLLGGLRSSLVSDVVQAALAVGFLTVVLGVIKSSSNGFDCQDYNNCSLMTWNPVPGRKKFSLEGGLDLALTGLLQGSLSYGFFDPILTDRAFLADPRNMRRAFLLGGTTAAIFILFFSLLGVYGNMRAQLETSSSAGDYEDLLAGKPAAVARSIGQGFFSIVNLVFLTSSISTVDSTFACTSKLVGLELSGFFTTGRPRTPGEASMRDLLLGRVSCILMAIVGSLPLLQNPKALNATTVSGTIVLGLGPPILFARWMKGYRPLAFHVPFWIGVGMGCLYQLSTSRPDLVSIDWLKIGDGNYAELLGVNVVGTVLVFGFFALAALENRTGQDFGNAGARRWAKEMANANSSELEPVKGAVEGEPYPNPNPDDTSKYEHSRAGAAAYESKEAGDMHNAEAPKV